MSAQTALPLAATVSNAPAALVQSPRRCPRRATAFLRSCTIPIFSQGNRVPTKAQPAVPEPFLAHFLNQRFLTLMPCQTAAIIPPATFGGGARCPAEMIIYRVRSHWMDEFVLE